MADDDFTRLTLDSNADYLSRFVSVYPQIVLPDAEKLSPGKVVSLVLNGLSVSRKCCGLAFSRFSRHRQYHLNVRPETRPDRAIRLRPERWRSGRSSKCFPLSQGHGLRF